MRVHFLGHASLLVQSNGSNILSDPLFGPTLGHDSNQVYPARTILAEHLPPLDLVAISHRHNDHFDLNSLRRIRSLGNPQVLMPDDPPLEQSLRALGYTRIRRIQPLESFTAGPLTITATPSNVNCPEFGYVLSDSEGVVWNQVDSHFEPYVDEVLSRLERGVDVALMPYQSGAFNEFIPLLGERMEDSTVASLRETAAAWRGTLLKAVEMIRPQMVIPFANGLCYPEEVEAMNSLHFVEPDKTLLEAVGARWPEIKRQLAYPGLRLSFRNGVPEVEEMPGAWLNGVSRPGDRCRFHPERRLPEQIAPLLPAPAGDPESRLRALLEDARLCVRWFSDRADSTFRELGRSISVVADPAWYLVVDGLQKPLRYVLRWSADAAVFEELPASAEAGSPQMRIHANDLTGILENRIDLYDVVLGARVRLRLPEGVPVSNANVTKFCIDPAWFALAHAKVGDGPVERVGLTAVA